MHVKRNTRYHPSQASTQRLQHYAKPLHATRHAIPPRRIYTGPIATTSNPTIFLSAGEASGDHYGAQIITEFTRRHSGATFFGLGGREMEAAGQDRIVRAEDVAHMGITEVLRHAPRVYSSYRRLVASIKQRRPHAAVLIDFPDVNLRLARELKSLNIPVVYFVSPQLWAWKRSRLRWVQQRVDRMMVIFPFEEPFYRERQVNATFTGHPLAELPLPTISHDHYATKHSLDTVKQWIALLPGSRKKEVYANLPTMLEGVSRLSDDYEFLLPVASTLDPAWVRELANPWLSEFQRNTPSKLSNLHFVPDAREALHHARASIVASGTATVQAAVIGNPLIIVYRVSPLTFKLAKSLVHYPPEVWSAGLDAFGNLPIGMVNLIASHRIVPELIQDQFTAANVASALRPLLDDSPERTRMISDLADLRQKLLPQAGTSSIGQVADAVDSLLNPSSEPTCRPEAKSQLSASK